MFNDLENLTRNISLSFQTVGEKLKENENRKKFYKYTQKFLGVLTFKFFLSDKTHKSLKIYINQLGILCQLF